MSDCPKPVRTCTSQTLATAQAAVCEDWEACLPFGAMLAYENGCLKYTPGEPPADGVYGLITVQNGCIVSLDEEPVAKYQADSCAPVPCPCSEDSDTSSGLCDPSTTTGNLYTCDSAGKPLVRVYINGGDNVSVTGYGTRTSPFVITIDQGDAGITSIRSITDAITVSTSDGVATIAHKDGWNERTINGMVFDNYGHLIDYDDSTAASSIIGIVGTNGISAETSSAGIATIKLADPANNLNGDYIVGGYTLTLDSWNRVYNLVRDISGTEGTYALGAYNVEVNDYGSIEGVTAANTDGNTFHALLSGDGSSTTLSATFSLRFPTYLMVELMTTASSSSWGSGLTVRVDNAAVADILVFASASSTSSYPTIVRAAPGGVYGTGSHTVTLVQSSGFPSSTISLSVRAVGPFNSASLS